MKETTSSRLSRRSTATQSVVTLLFFVIIIVLLNYLGFKHYEHKDLSQSQYYTLSPKTVDVLKKLDSPVTITTLLNIQDPHSDQIDRLLKEYQRVGGKNIVIEKIDLAYDSARAVELQKRLHFEATDFLIIFEYKTRSHFVKQDDLFDVNPMTGQTGAFKGERQFTSAIVSVVEGKASKIYFTDGHGEHSFQDTQSPRGYGTLAQSLKSENVEMSLLNLTTSGEVPADAEAVIIAGPSVSFSPIEVQALDKYLASNGKLLVLLDPYVQLGLDDLLKKYSLKFEDDLVLYRVLTSNGAETTMPLVAVVKTGFSNHPITERFAQADVQLIIQDPTRSITILPDAKGQPPQTTKFLLQTDASAWGWIPKNTSIPEDPRSLTYNKITDLGGPLIIAAAYDGGMTTDPATKATMTGTRIVAIGCSKFLENDASAHDISLNFFMNSLDWLVKKDAVLDIAPKAPQQYDLTLSPMQFRTVIWCALFFVPGGALALGIFIWFSRRK